MRPIKCGSGPRQLRRELPLDLFSLYGNFCLGEVKGWGKKNIKKASPGAQPRPVETCALGKEILCKFLDALQK